jgi:GGDEF domain-containing protein
VAEVIAQRAADAGRCRAFVYFDFDNFKPFNDRYGFRNGDRVIMLFADIVKTLATAPRDFIGHLGGDDFFACIEAKSLSSALVPLREAAARFAREATSFYASEDRDRGWILGKDRCGVEQRFELLGVSLAVVFLSPGGMLDAEGLSDLLARLKREAKVAPEHIAAQSLGPEDGEPAPRDAPAAPVLKTPRTAKKQNERRVDIVFTPSLLAAF